MLNFVLALENSRHEYVANQTRLLGQPKVSTQDGLDILEWQRKPTSDNVATLADGADPSAKSVVVDFSLPLTVFGDARAVCNQWRTSFILFFRDGLALEDGTKLPKMVRIIQHYLHMCG